MSYCVKTKDVDGSVTVRSYKILKNAVARFLEMAGGTMEGAISEHFWQQDIPPTLEQLDAKEEFHVRTVSNFGCVVTITKEK